MARETGPGGFAAAWGAGLGPNPGSASNQLREPRQALQIFPAKRLPHLEMRLAAASTAMLLLFLYLFVLRVK